MGTRTNIKLGTLWLYRHWDGYPAETGRHLAQTLKQLGPYGRTKLGFANALLTEQYDKQPYEKKARQVYTLTEGEHGDIEWLYEVSFNSGKPVFKVRERNWKIDDWIDHPRMSEKQFRSFVARDMLEMRKRIKAMKTKNAA